MLWRHSQVVRQGSAKPPPPVRFRVPPPDFSLRAMPILYCVFVAGVAELVDARDLKSLERKFVPVRVRSSAPST